MQRTVSAGRPRHRLPASAAGVARSGRACRPGGRNTGSSGSITAAHRPARRPPRRSSRSRSDGDAVALPGAQRLLQQPQAHDVAQVADGAVDAALVGEVGRAGCPRSAPGASSSTPDQRPGAAGDVGEAAPPARARRRRPRRCRASRPAITGTGRSPRRRGRASASSVPDRRRPGSRSGGSSPTARPRRVDQISADHRPRADVEQAGGGGVGHLGAALAGQPVAEQVGDQQQPVARAASGARPGPRRAGRGC